MNMVKEKDSSRIKKLIKKIADARDIEKKLMFDSENSELQGLQRRLKEISDKADLAFNDVVIKKAKLKDASERMQKLEKQLDELILNIRKYRGLELKKKLLIK